MSEDPEPPQQREWVEAFFKHEPSIRGLLDELEEERLLGNHDTVRDQLRSFAQAHDGVFRVVALSVLDVDPFYTDLQAQYDVATAPIEELQAFGSDYHLLEEPLELVFLEEIYGYYNPSPSVARRWRYDESRQMPRVAIELYSGEVSVGEFEQPPGQALTVAGLIIDSVAELLERANSHDDPITTGELDRVTELCEELTRDIERMETATAQAKETQDNTEATDPDPYNDRGVY